VEGKAIDNGGRRAHAFSSQPLWNVSKGAEVVAKPRTFLA
jgi:hypothetical protein